MKITQFAPRFVEYVPDQLEQGILYLSMEYATASHACACGCGREVVTPISPHGWQMRYDGLNVSLEPSIGNWSFPCRSHYWIKGGRVRWDRDMSQHAIDEGRERDRRARERYYIHRGDSAAKLHEESPQSSKAVSKPAISTSRSPVTWWDRFSSYLRGK